MKIVQLAIVGYALVAALAVGAMVQGSFAGVSTQLVAVLGAR